MESEAGDRHKWSSAVCFEYMCMVNSYKILICSTDLASTKPLEIVMLLNVSMIGLEPGRRSVFTSSVAGIRTSCRYMMSMQMRFNSQENRNQGLLLPPFMPLYSCSSFKVTLARCHGVDGRRGVVWSHWATSKLYRIHSIWIYTSSKTYFCCIPVIIFSQYCNQLFTDCWSHW